MTKNGTILGSICDPFWYLKTCTFLNEKMTAPGTKNGAKLGSQKAPQKIIPLAFPGTLRTLGALGRPRSHQGVFWASFGDPLASHRLHLTSSGGRSWPLLVPIKSCGRPLATP